MRYALKVLAFDLNHFWGSAKSRQSPFQRLRNLGAKTIPSVSQQGHGHVHPGRAGPGDERLRRCEVVSKGGFSVYFVPHSSCVPEASLSMNWIRDKIDRENPLMSEA